MSSTRIYLNRNCSKCRSSLQLLESKGIEADIVEYLSAPPGVDELRTILDLLSLEPRDLMRRQEAPYTALNLADESLSRDALIQAMVENPILIERPIVIHNGKATIGRPPEKILDIL